MKFKKFRLYYSNEQLRGIFLFIIIIIVLQLIYLGLNFYPKNENSFVKDNLTTLNKEFDSLRKIELAKKKNIIFKVNPNYLNDYKGYQLGLSTSQIDSILNFRKKGNYFTSLKQFQKIANIPDSLTQKIKANLQFNSFKKYKKEKVIQKQNKIAEQDLNKVSAKDLIKIKGISYLIANRIVKYRKRLGGFTFKEQLFEVYDLDKKLAQTILIQYPIKSVPKLNRLNINNASIKDLIRIPYINYSLAKNILTYRNEVAEIQSLEELKKIDRFPIKNFKLIALYLSLN
ncbi:MAG: helix-hairpin-helix domain-containing protein [Lutibacter sp.]